MATSGFERFPRLVTSLDELPPQSAAALASQLQPDEVIVQALFTPRVALLGQRTGWHAWLWRLLPWEWSPEWVLIATQERLLLGATALPGAAPVVSSLRPADLLYMELGTILLFSWFDSATAQPTARNAPASTSTLWVSTTFAGCSFVWRRRQPVVPRLPPAMCDQNALADLPFKFRNIIAQRLLAPGERVEAAFFRPPLCSGGHSLWRRPHPTGLALVLTNYHLLVATEDESSSVGTVSYGFIARCYPRVQLQAIHLAPEGDDLWVKLSVGLAVHA